MVGLLGLSFNILQYMGSECVFENTLMVDSIGWNAIR